MTFVSVLLPELIFLAYLVYACVYIGILTTSYHKYILYNISYYKYSAIFCVLWLAGHEHLFGIFQATHLQKD